ncbi:hypothetical protein [Pedobacter antarcticus]|uniref:hypothetical protein n=1 Tax=Pedobacter antarcticus TaxID=34086 RepID=UPI00292DF1CB|nr:hypothetical protein [Pedobacter antarcticus]
MSQKATTDQILDAAIAHAKKELGEDQFTKNKDAVQAITTDFIAGATFVNNLK